MTRPHDDEALAWFVRLRSDAAGPRDHAAFAAWRARDPAHARAYDQLAGLWRDLDELPDPRPQPSRRGFILAGALAASAAVIAGSGLYATDALRATGTALTRQTLADGSALELDAGSDVAVEMTAEARVVTLKRGRLFVTVARDPARPFTVVAGNGRTTALGTAFVVARRGERVTVAVTESAVSVAAGQATRRIQAGQRLTYGPAGADEPTALGPADTAWRQGKLVFQNEALADVVADLGRYRPGRIMLLGDDLAALRVSGIFDIGNPEGVLTAIARTLPVRLTRLTPYLVVIRPT